MLREGLNENWLTGCFRKNNGTIEFFLLYVEINFSLRVYVKNKLMWILVYEDELGLVKISVKSKGFLQKCQNNG